MGTYSSKGVLVAPEGNVLKQHVVEHKMDIPRPGGQNRMRMETDSRGLRRSPVSKSVAPKLGVV